MYSILFFERVQLIRDRVHLISFYLLKWKPVNDSFPEVGNNFFPDPRICTNWKRNLFSSKETTPGGRTLSAVCNAII